MIGNIILPYKAPVPSFDPDEAFDPTTHIATEAAFIQLLENEVYDEKYIGYKVQLGNSVDYDNGIWVIADVNHDSANTGQTDCYDLISQDIFHVSAFGSAQNWRTSTSRTWLNETFYPGFNNIFKNHIMNLKYYSQSVSGGGWYTDDYIILPSKVEVYGGTDSSYYDGNAIYPIFMTTPTAGTSSNTSRIKNNINGTSNYWWTRSGDSTSDYNIWYVNSNGSMSSVSYNSTRYLAPIIRVQ